VQRPSGLSRQAAVHEDVASRLKLVQTAELEIDRQAAGAAAREHLGCKTVALQRISDAEQLVERAPHGSAAGVDVDDGLQLALISLKAFEPHASAAHDRVDNRQCL